jgi:DNA polymerase
VPNVHPRYPQEHTVAFIGKAPGVNEVSVGLPFVGASSYHLWSTAAKHGFTRDTSFVGNVCQVHPPGDNIELFSWTGPEIQSGLDQLWKDLAVVKPTLCILLGSTALRAFTGETAILNWRGSLFMAKGYKCIATVHPAAVSREYGLKPLLDFDLRRAREEMGTKTLSLPQRTLEVDLSAHEIIERLRRIKVTKPTIAIDIEGYVNHMTCISIATSPTSCFVVPFDHLSEDIEWQVWRALSDVLADPTIPKILQNALYDTFVLQYGHNIPVRGVNDDTMLAHWELMCEMPKSLAFQASIYTREPYWKDERKDEDRHNRLLYAAKDSAVTYEIRNSLRTRFSPTAFRHYQLNLALLDPLLYMEMRGMRYDQTLAKQKVTWVQLQSYKLQWALNEVAGYPHPTTVQGWLEWAAPVLCFKKMLPLVKEPKDLERHSKVTQLHNSVPVSRLLTKGDLSLPVQGELAALTEYGLNVESKLQIADYLYRQLNLPIQYKKEKGRRTEKETTDALALLTLYAKTKDPTLRLILVLRAQRTRLETLQAKHDPDGRIRCGYNVVGSETGRLTCYKSPTGSGFNLQTVASRDRDLFVADPGYWMFQCDLSGADGWTVAAHCASCGDRTMLDDMLAGIKIYKIIALFHLYGKKVFTWSRDEILRATQTANIPLWLSFACKRVFHGGNYGMGTTTMAAQILQDSYKKSGTPLVVSPQTCADLLSYKNTRWPGVLAWHQKIKQQLLTKGYLVAASGHQRTFFGRKDDYSTFKDACANEPQANTTYVTNLALMRLWTDPENRLLYDHTKDDNPRVGLIPGPVRVADRSSNSLLNHPVSPETGSSGEGCECPSRTTLRIQPLHQVHDALIGQFNKGDTDWAIRRIRGYFNNPITIAGHTITIPYEGGYGPSWGELKEGSL